jgi:hypothetical protein
MSELQDIQQEVGEWAVENFGEKQPATYPLGGAGEEMGELMHSVLKRLQGIRLEEDGVGVEAEVDAVGDIGVYLFDYLYRSGIEFEIDGTIREAAEDYDKQRSDMMMLGHLFQEYGYLWEAETENYHDNDKLLSVVTIFVILDIICEMRESLPTFKECVEVAWYGEVQDREWDADVEV